MRALLRGFKRLDTGALTICLPGGESLLFGRIGSALQATIHIKNYKFFSRCVLGGDVGFGESYMAGEWDSDDITQLISVFILNNETVYGGRFKSALLYGLLNYFYWAWEKNTISKTRERIEAHYDTGNRFFAKFLDPSMTYSCGIYRTPQDTLAAAQENKRRTVIQKACIGSSDHVLEIGCGWGSLAVEAARQTGCRVTAITVSKAQYRFACRRVREENLEGQVEILLADYRQVRGRFDKIISIEMLEAVGHTYFSTFFKCCHHLLNPGGTMVLQVITSSDNVYHTARKRCGWVIKHIFPGGLIPSLTILNQAMATESDFIIEHVENIGPHYANTLRDWRIRYLEVLPKIAAMGFEGPFLRKWVYFFSYCEAAFKTRHLNDHQIVLTRPGKDLADPPQASD